MSVQYLDEHFTTTDLDADGLPLYGPKKSGVIALDCSFAFCSDEQVAIGQGATDIKLLGCVFRDSEKGILIGTGDKVDREIETGAKVTIENIDADNVSRRMPYARHAVITIDGGTIRNWQGGVKTYAMRFEDGCKVVIRNVHFHQDRFRWEWKQWLRALFGGKLLGGWTAVTTDGSCEVVMENCTKNKWWLCWFGRGITRTNCRTI